MLVTRNLYLAMKQFSVQYAGQWLWIDSISIDQSDEAKKEREHQVGNHARYLLSGSGGLGLARRVW
jgi:hypothetical protein